MIGCFERDIISIMEEIYCIIMICMVIFCNVVIKRFQKCIIFESTGFDSQKELTDST